MQPRLVLRRRSGIGGLRKLDFVRDWSGRGLRRIQIWRSRRRDGRRLRHRRFLLVAKRPPAGARLGSHNLAAGSYNENANKNTRCESHRTTPPFKREENFSLVGYSSNWGRGVSQNRRTAPRLVAPVLADAYMQAHSPASGIVVPRGELTYHGVRRRTRAAC